MEKSQSSDILHLFTKKIIDFRSSQIDPLLTQKNYEEAIWKCEQYLTSLQKDSLEYAEVLELISYLYFKKGVDQSIVEEGNNHYFLFNLKAGDAIRNVSDASTSTFDTVGVVTKVTRNGVEIDYAEGTTPLRYINSPTFIPLDSLSKKVEKDEWSLVTFANGKEEDVKLQGEDTFKIAYEYSLRATKPIANIDNKNPEALKYLKFDSYLKSLSVMKINKLALAKSERESKTKEITWTNLFRTYVNIQKYGVPLPYLGDTEYDRQIAKIEKSAEFTEKITQNLETGKDLLDGLPPLYQIKQVDPILWGKIEELNKVNPEEKAIVENDAIRSLTQDKEYNEAMALYLDTVSNLLTKEVNLSSDILKKAESYSDFKFKSNVQHLLIKSGVQSILKTSDGKPSLTAKINELISAGDIEADIPLVTTPEDLARVYYPSEKGSPILKYNMDAKKYNESLPLGKERPVFYLPDICREYNRLIAIHYAMYNSYIVLKDLNRSRDEILGKEKLKKLLNFGNGILEMINDPSTAIMLASGAASGEIIGKTLFSLARKQVAKKLVEQTGKEIGEVILTEEFNIGVVSYMKSIPRQMIASLLFEAPLFHTLTNIGNMALGKEIDWTPRGYLSTIWTIGWLKGVSRLGSELGSSGFLKEFREKGLLGKAVYHVVNQTVDISTKAATFTGADLSFIWLDSKVEGRQITKEEWNQILASTPNRSLQFVLAFKLLEAPTNRLIRKQENNKSNLSDIRSQKDSEPAAIKEEKDQTSQTLPPLLSAKELAKTPIGTQVTFYQLTTDPRQNKVVTVSGILTSINDDGTFSIKEDGLIQIVMRELIVKDPSKSIDPKKELVAKRSDELIYQSGNFSKRWLEELLITDDFRPEKMFSFVENIELRDKLQTLLGEWDRLSRERLNLIVEIGSESEQLRELKLKIAEVEGRFEQVANLKLGVFEHLRKMRASSISSAIFRKFDRLGKTDSLSDRKSIASEILELARVGFLTLGIAVKEESFFTINRKPTFQGLRIIPVSGVSYLNDYALHIQREYGGAVAFIPGDFAANNSSADSFQFHIPNQVYGIGLSPKCLSERMSIDHTMIHEEAHLEQYLNEAKGKVGPISMIARSLKQKGESESPLSSEFDNMSEKVVYKYLQSFDEITAYAKEASFIGSEILRLGFNPTSAKVQRELVSLQKGLTNAIKYGQRMSAQTIFIVDRIIQADDAGQVKRTYLRTEETRWEDHYLELSVHDQQSFALLIRLTPEEAEMLKPNIKSTYQDFPVTDEAYLVLNAVRERLQIARKIGEEMGYQFQNIKNAADNGDWQLAIDLAKKLPESYRHFEESSGSDSSIP